MKPKNKLDYKTLALSLKGNRGKILKKIKKLKKLFDKETKCFK